MAAGSPVSSNNLPATASQRGNVLRGAAVTAMTVSATTGSLPTANTTITIANAATPTVSELLEFCVDLNARYNALLTSLRDAGVIAS